MTSRIVLSVGQFLVATLLIAAVVEPSFAQGTPAQGTALQPVRVRMDWIPTGMYGAFYYGQRRGYYAREGLNVEVLPGQGSNAVMDGLYSGDVDFGFHSCWGMAIGVSRGRPIISVATFTGKLGFAFFYPKDSGVTSLKDFKGKRIVVSAGLDTQLYPTVLAANGLPGDLMTQVNVDPSQKVATYARGQADIVNTHVAGSYPSMNKQRPSSYILWSDAGFVLPDFCITTTKAKLASSPQLVEKFVRATYAATAEAAKNIQDTAAAGVEMFPLLNKDNLAEEWKLMTELFYSDGTKGCPHGWHSPSDWTKGLETLRKHGGLEGSIEDHSIFYTNQFFPCNR